MKIAKKILAMVMALSMMLSMSVFALEFPDVKADDTNEEAINVLSSLGIIKGYEDGTFLPDKEVTRAELTSLLMRLLNLSLTGVPVADSGYTDVANNHWAVYDIKTASGMGIIKGFGDGNFGPEAPVTFEQAVKMVVAMLGYESVAIDKGGWPNGYVTQGRDLGLLKKAEMVQTNPAPRKIIAQILYNALNVDLMEKVTTSSAEKDYYEIKKGKSVLSEYMQIEKVEGVVVENAITTLSDDESQVLSDEVMIEHGRTTEKFKIDAAKKAPDYLGLDVVAYVKYDELRVNKEIKHIMTKGDVKEVKLDAQEIETFSKSKIEVENEKTGKVTTYKIDDSKVKFIYNGKYIDTDDAYDNDLVLPEIGTVTLVDSGSGYNLIKIESYNNYVVKTVDTSANEIYVDSEIAKDNRTKVVVPLDDIFDYNIKILKDNNEIQLGAIKKGNIISVKENVDAQNGIKNIEILVSDAKKTGKITEADSNDNYVIGSVTYKLAPSLKDTSIGQKVVYGANGTYYLDAFGQIAYAEFTAGETYKYGYIMRARATSKDGGDTVGAVKLYDYTAKAFKTYNFASRVTIDGKKYTDHNDAVDAVVAAANLLEDRDDNENADEGAQPIKYILNSAGDISDINTVDNDNGDDDSFVVSNYALSEEYNTSNRYFKTSGGNIKIDTKTIVFSIPNDRSKETKYSIKTYSYFKANAPYEIEVVETNSSGIASVIILYESNLDEDVHYQSPIFVVSEIKDVYVDGDNKVQMTGYNFVTGAEAKYILESKSHIEGIGADGADVEKGDIIRFGLTPEGEVNENVYMYLDASEAADGNHPETEYSALIAADASKYPLKAVSLISKFNEEKYSKYSLSDLGDRYVFIYGTPVSVVTDDTNSISFIDAVVDSSFEGKIGNAVSFNVSNNVSIFKYDANETDKKMLSVIPSSDKEGTTSGILDIKTYDIAEKDCDNVYIYVVGEVLKAIYVIK